MKQPTDSNFDNYKFASSVAAATMAACWLEHDAVILDTETTGLEWGCEVVEISIIEARTGLILMNTLVRPINPIPAEATAIHGITNEMVADAPLFFDIAISVAQILSGRTVIAYNSAFDKKMLCSSAAYSSGEPPYVNSDFQCAMLAYAQYKGDWNHGHGDFKWHSLVNAAKQQGIALEGTAHRALYDCQLTRELILKMAAE
ncbi:3'-5' exonuclease [Shewanella baltica]|uniref:3'-5' exonuclease n=1 Tax=Shewanella baltica TaxID=62322 RepID=UPI0001DB83C3|nr:3'-5' exonuclease [Shewanella baltica]ADT95080.1 Exonuclease RNase T and DNA polymerase III [Shewanella baltica OS678]